MASIHRKRFELELKKIAKYNPQIYLNSENTEILYDFETQSSLSTSCNNSIFDCYKLHFAEYYKKKDQNINISKIILKGRFYSIKVMLNNFYPMDSIKIELNMNKRVEMICRFVSFYLKKSGLNDDIINKIIEISINSDALCLYRRNHYIHSKKFILDFGNTSYAIFDFDQKMSNSPIKFIGDYIEDYLELCKKYCYSYQFINRWDIDTDPKYYFNTEIIRRFNINFHYY